MSEEYKRMSGSSIKWLFFLGVLGIGLLCFFTVVHPLYIYDTDDWTYISYSRHAWPTIKEWNPTKILPETLMPLTAEIGLKFIMPLTKDYIGSMAIAFAIILVLFILAYIYQMGRVLEKMFSIKIENIFSILIIFLLFHFLPFSVNITDNVYMFYGGSVNCTFNYLIPGLINATMVMYMLTNDFGRKNGCYGVLILVIYLCLNSNMFHSILLAVFAATNILFSLIKRIYQEKRFNIKYILNTKFIKENIFWIGIDIVWFFMIIFEMQGKRAARAATSIFELPIKETFIKFINSFISLNKIYLISMLGFIIIGLMFCFFYSCKVKWKLNESECRYILVIIKIVICFIITCIYQILLCAKVSPSYILGNLVSFTWLFWLMLLAFISITYVVSKVPKVVICLPLLIYILMFETIIDGRSYAENNVAGLKAETIKALDENIVRQVVEAEKRGVDTVNVHVPVHNSEDWPIALSYGGGRIATTLYRHGVIRKPISVNLIMDYNINEEFDID